MHRFVTTAPCGGWLVLMAGALALGTGAVRGGTMETSTGNVSYQLQIASDEALLEDPDDPMTAMLAAWKTQFDLQLARNMPFMLLKNTSMGTSAELTRLRLTIGDSAHDFDWVRSIAASSGVGVAIGGVDMIEGGSRGDEVDLLLTGFLPGASLLFQVDIDPDLPSVFALSDFRTVLFDGNGAGAADNALISATFEDPQAVSELTIGNNLLDFPVEGPWYVGPGFHAYERMDHVTVFAHRGEGQLQMGETVSEPNTFSLAALGGLVIAWAGLRRRRAGKS